MYNILYIREEDFTRSVGWLESVTRESVSSPERRISSTTHSSLSTSTGNLNSHVLLLSLHNFKNVLSFKAKAIEKSILKTSTLIRDFSTRYSSVSADLKKSLTSVCQNHPLYNYMSTTNT